MGRRREPRPGNRAWSQSWEGGTSFELTRFVNSCGADLMDGPDASNLFLVDRRPAQILSTVTCEYFPFFFSLPAGQGQTAVVCHARPAIHMAETDLSLLFSFWRLRNAIDGRAPGGSLGTLLAERGGGATVPKKAGPGSLWPCCTRWLEKIGWGPIATRVFPPMIFPGCPSRAVDNSG